MRTLVSLLWNGTSINFNSITVKRSESIKSDYIEVKFTDLSLVKSGDSIKFSVGDSLQLFAKVDSTGSTLDTSSTSNDLIFSGIIKEIKVQKEGRKRQVTIKGVSRTYELMNRLWSKSYSDTVPNIIKNIIDFTSLQTDGTYNITATLDTTSPYTSGIQAKRPDGSDFPTKKFGMAHKPVFEFMDNLSQIEYTNSESEISSGNKVCKRPFKYYIDTQNVFHWFYPTDTANYEMVVGETTPQSSDTKSHYIIGTNLTYSQFGEVNFIIFKAGEDMDNTQILDFDLDPTTKSLNTADSFRSWLDISREMKRKDAAAGNITYTESDKYAYPSSYPVTPAWDSQGRAVNSDSEYNNNFREEAIKIAKARCQREFSMTGNPRWKGSITLIGEVLEPTQLIKFTDSNIGITSKNLRIKNVTHNITKSSYTTTLDVEEDIPEVN